MQDCGASRSIIQHHNKATIEREMATGMLELLVLSEVVTMSEKLFFQYSWIGIVSIFTFLVKL